MHPALQFTWETDDAETQLRAALDLVDRLDPPDDLRAQTYTFAVQLLTQTAMRSGGVVIPQGPQG